MTDTIDELTLNVHIKGKGMLTLQGVSYATEEGYWLLGEQDVDAIIQEWASVQGHEAQWANSCWALAYADATPGGVAPNVHVGIWNEYEEDGEWNFDEFPFHGHVTTTTPAPEPQPPVEPEERPSDAQFRHFGMEVAATLALWSQARFHEGEMIDSIASFARRRLGIEVTDYDRATPERQAMWDKLAEAFDVEGPTEEQIDNG